MRGEAAMAEDWLGRWKEGRIGWHEARGNAALRRNWPELATGSTVLVPLCGKSVDMMWLAEKGMIIIGVELSGTAIEAFFAEQELRYDLDRSGALAAFRADERPITLYCGDFFEFRGATFDALYDRGALVALPEDLRPQYVRRVNDLLRPDAFRLIVTLEYDQSRAAGPPFSVLPDEMRRYWPDLERIGATNEIDNCPPKFREAGLDQVMEAVWIPAVP